MHPGMRYKSMEWQKAKRETAEMRRLLRSSTGRQHLAPVFIRKSLKQLDDLDSRFSPPEARGQREPRRLFTPRPPAEPAKPARVTWRERRDRERRADLEDQQLISDTRKLKDSLETALKLTSARYRWH